MIRLVGKLWNLSHVVDRISEFTGKSVSFLVVILMLIFCWEVLVRSVFNSPTIWAHESTQYVFGLYFVLGAAYVLKRGGMVRVDILVSRFKPRTQATIDGITSIVGLLFLWAIIWKGFDLMLFAIKINETSPSVWSPPLYPIKIIAVVGTILLFMQAFVNSIRNMITGISGRVLP